MCAEGPGRAVALAQVLLSVDVGELPLPSGDEDRKFLAESRWRGRLSVGQCKKWRRTGRDGQIPRCLDESGRTRPPCAPDTICHEQCIGKVIHVL